MSKIFDNLNKEQTIAVKETEGIISLIASAGSGKTRTLTNRFAYIVDSGKATPDKILSVTFTNKAANEMKERIYEMIGSTALPYVTTFHSLANRILREDIDKIGYQKNFKILDEEDQKEVLKGIYDILSLKAKEYPYKEIINNVIGEGCKSGTRYLIDNYEEILTEMDLIDVETLIEEADTIEEKILLMYLYEEKKSSYLDFEDLLNLTLYLFDTKPNVKEKWQNTFDYIQVDEFQDVSRKDFKLVCSLFEKCRNLFVVGDPDQLIYGFRGSKIEYITQFKSKIADALDDDMIEDEVKLLFLNTNYRSTPEIVNASNSLIEKNSERIKKEAIAYKVNGQRVQHKNLKSLSKEAEWIASKIQRMDYNYSDIVILYRSPTYLSILERALKQNRIPYKIVAGLSFYERKEIKDILAVLSLASYGDDLSITRLLNNFSFGIKKAKIDKIKQYSRHMKISMYEALKDLANTKEFEKTKAYDFIDVIERIKRCDGNVPIEDIIYMVIKLFEMEKLYIDEETERIANMNELKYSAKTYEYSICGEDSVLTIADYLSSLALCSGTDDYETETEEKIKLMTIHASKGLEFPVVFLVNMIEGVSPSSRIKTRDDLEEERRVIYVGMTRAKDELYMTSSEGYDFDRKQQRMSRFLFEINEFLVDRDF